MTTTLSFLLFLLISTGEPSDVAVIVNKTVPVDSADAATLARIYTLSNRTWSDGTRITPLNLKSQDELKEKFYDFLGMGSTNIKKLWLRLQLTGEARPPEALKTEQEILEKVVATPGAIGFVRINKTTPDVKIIALIE